MVHLEKRLANVPKYLLALCRLCFQLAGPDASGVRAFRRCCAEGCSLASSPVIRARGSSAILGVLALVAPSPFSCFERGLFRLPPPHSFRVASSPAAQHQH